MDSNEASEENEENEELDDNDNIHNKNVFIISLKLLKKFKDMHIGYDDNIIINYIHEIGLPMAFTSVKYLSQYLYFHKICSSFYEIFSTISDNKKIIDVIISLLKENYYILADNESIHYNYIYLAEKIFQKLIISKDEKNNISKIPLIILNKYNNNINKEKNIHINKIILELSFESNGRLDIYMKIHILKSILIFINNSKFYSYIHLFEKMEFDLINLYQNSLTNKLEENKYNHLLNIFADIDNKKKWDEYLLNLKKLLSEYQNINDEKSIKILEKLFIQLLGHFNRNIRNFSVKMLNMIYDNTFWQDRGAFPESNICIKFIGENVIIEILVKKEDYIPKCIILITSKPNENKNVNHQCFSYLKPQKEEIDKQEIKLIFSLGIPKKCGYYDWYIVKFTKGKFTNLKIINPKNKKDLIPGKGRFIVLNKDLKKFSIHEILCDELNNKINEQNKINKIGSFKNLEKKLDYYNQIQNINCLYIIGALERDNDIIYEENSGKIIDIGNVNSSPFAITSRINISSILGGDKSFISLVNKAHEKNMKIIIDMFDRISSVRYNRKYRNLLLRHLDKDGKINIYYGSDGKNIKYEDCSLLNYRKIEAWDLLLTEIKTLIEKYNIDGIHMDNCQSWPNIMKLNLYEMFRIDLDGKKAYNSLEILMGK